MIGLALRRRFDSAAPSPVVCERRVPDGVDARVDGAQPSRPDPVLDRPAPNPHRDELVARDDAVVLVGPFPDLPVG
jgi:hypothetical protein